MYPYDNIEDARPRSLTLTQGMTVNVVTVREYTPTP